MPVSSASSARLYVAVIVCEILVIAALWLLGRVYA
jgi:hypothetical protein